MQDSIKKVLQAYYIHGLSNREIFEKFGLTSSKKSFSHERIYELFLPYVHEELKCEFCDSNLLSDYASKNTTTVAKIAIFFHSPTELKEVAVSHDTLEQQRPEPNYRTQDGFKIGFPYCKACTHKPVDGCRCPSCIKVRSESKIKAIKLVIEGSQFSRVPCFDQLNCRDSLNLLIALESLNIARSDNLARLDAELTGLPDSILDTLKYHALIRVSQRSLRNAVSMINSSEYVVNPERLEYQINFSGSARSIIRDIQRESLFKIKDPRHSWELLDIWEGLAIEESLAVLKHYCSKQELQCESSEKLISSIQRSLNRYGLAQTCRYICNSVRRSAVFIREQGIHQLEERNSIYRNLNFWVDDDRARTYQAPPFIRMEGVLSEPMPVMIFSHTFLEPYSIDYFTHPICLDSLS